MQAIGGQPYSAIRVPDGAPVHCERHRPEQTTLYRLVQQHAATLFEQTEADSGADLPQFVKDECDAFLESGILAHGFAFEIDMEHGPNCGGDLKIITAILEVAPGTNGLEDRLCLAHARAPPRAPARRPQLQAA